MHKSIPLCVSCGHHHYLDIRCEICGHVGRSQIFYKMRSKAKDASAISFNYYAKHDLHDFIPLQLLLIEMTKIPSDQLLSYDVFLVSSGTLSSQQLLHMTYTVHNCLRTYTVGNLPVGVALLKFIDSQVLKLSYIFISHDFRRQRYASDIIHRLLLSPPISLSSQSIVLIVDVADISNIIINNSHPSDETLRDCVSRLMQLGFRDAGGGRLLWAY